jgi:hypothetical protein
MQTASPPRKDFTPAQRQKIVSAYRRGKLTQREFARQAGIGFSTLRKWLHQAAVPSPSREACFVEVPNLISSSPPPAPYRLHLPNQVLLEIGPGFQTGEVAALLGLLITP